MLGTSRPLKQSQLLKQAHSSLLQDLQAPTLYTLQACLLLKQFIRSHDEINVQCANSWIPLSRVITCARMMNLHRDPSHLDIARREIKLRRRLWWALYVVDCWAPLSSEHSSYIASDSFDTMLLLIDDADCEEIIDHTLFDYVYPENANLLLHNQRYLSSFWLSMCTDSPPDQNDNGSYGSLKTNMPFQASIMLKQSRGSSELASSIQLLPAISKEHECARIRQSSLSLIEKSRTPRVYISHV